MPETIFKKLRSETPILLEDLSKLLNLRDWTSVSRVESGNQQPTRDMLLLYHLLYDKEISKLMKGELEKMKTIFACRTVEQIERLKERNNPFDTQERIEYLDAFYEKITN